ncbi:hypothetical protein BGZ83_008132 [Gryganskiella cystojenkinii]|nr:hypothetical protein BGZ83_008132 [Gryganskiella cystojenkinii]
MSANQKSFLLLLLLVQSIFASVSITPASSDRSPSRAIIENQLPVAVETHEVIKVSNSDVVLISQMSNSVLLKAVVDDDGLVGELKAFQMSQAASGLHGLSNSRVYPGKVWLTLQHDNMLVRIDPKVNSLKKAPVIEQEIPVPTPGNGPHYIGEYGNDLWVSLKDSFDVLRISHVNTSDYTIYKGVNSPVFVAQHPVNKMFYAGQDAMSSIMKIDPATGSTNQIRIPASVGQTPVGMISGPQGVWFTLLGNNTQGTGTIGRINADDTIVYFKLTSAFGKDASLLHLAFDPDTTSNTLWLLSSSIIYDKALNMVIKVQFDAQWTAIQSEDDVVIPTQEDKAHRIFITPTNVFATELSSSKLLSMYTL